MTDEKAIVFIHPSAIVDNDVEIGGGKQKYGIFAIL